MFRGRFGQLIKDVEIRDSQFGRNHIRAIELAYRRSPHFDEYFSALAGLIEEPSERLLVDLNLGLIQWAMNMLGIKTPIVRASTLGVGGRRTALLADICMIVGGTQYISPLGSAAYLVGDQNVLGHHNVEILFQNYRHPEYRQLFGPFQPYACFIDLLFNCGREALNILRAGRAAAYSVEQVSALTRVSGDKQSAIVA
jgi:hypothetical protein